MKLYIKNTDKAYFINQRNDQIFVAEIAKSELGQEQEYWTFETYHDALDQLQRIYRMGDWFMAFVPKKGDLK